MRSWIGCLVALAAVAFVAPAAGLAADVPTIAVGGEALVSVVPDRIIVRLGVETRGTELATAKKANDAAVKSVLAVIQSLGVERRDVQTSSLQTEPLFDYGSGLVRTGFAVRQGLWVTLKDPARGEDLVGRAIAAGATNVQGIDYQTTEYKKHRMTARDLAIRAAREKAEAMAASLGRTVGPALRIEEGERSGWWYNSGWWGGPDNRMSQNVILAAETPHANEGTEGFALGTISIRANVNVTFELK